MDRWTIAALVLALAVSGCSDDDDDEEEAVASTTTTTTTTTTSTSTTDTAAPSEPPNAGSPTTPSTGTRAAPSPTATSSQSPVPLTFGSTEPTSGPASGDDVAVLADARLGVEPGLERVVFEFAGTTRPAYVVEYSDVAESAGSGAPVDVEGDAYLSVSLTPAIGTDLSGAEPVNIYTGPDRLPGDGAVHEAVLAGDFEGSIDWLLGLDGVRGYRVLALDGPPRVVVEISTG